MTAPNPTLIRRSVIAGRWYPGTEDSLAREVDRYLSQVDQEPIAGDLLGLISPHAGYTYSGQTAAHAYRQLDGRPVDTVILLGPSHAAWVGDYAVSDETAYETPLGRVPLDQSFVTDLAALVPLQRVHGDSEHALEIQLPFLQRQLGGFQMVPILMSADAPASAQELGLALAGLVRQRRQSGGEILLVASSDLHHIEDYDAVVRRDRAVVDAIAALDLESLISLFSDPLCSVCGRMAILALLYATKDLGADEVDILQQTNSGDVTGQRRAGQYTVGYIAAAVYRTSTL